MLQFMAEICGRSGPPSNQSNPFHIWQIKSGQKSGDYVRLKVFYPTADKGKKSANEIFVIGLELGCCRLSSNTDGTALWLYRLD